MAMAKTPSLRATSRKVSRWSLFAPGSLEITNHPFQPSPGYIALPRELAENGHRVLAAEAKALRQGYLDRSAAGHLWHIIQVAFWVGMVEVDGRRDNTVAD